MKTKELLKLSPDQLKIFTELQRIRMAWYTLFVILGLFSIGLLVFLYSVVWVKEQAAPKLILGGIDGVLGWCLKHVVVDLFPGKKRKS